MSEGFDEETAHMMHWTAWGNVSDLFANAERMKFVRAYKRKEERKGFIHLFSPFTLEGIEKELEAEIQIMLYQKSNLKPTAYVLQVDVKERSRIPQSSNGGEPSVNSRNAADDIRVDFPEFVNTESANNTLAMTRGAEDALTILRKRETEREGERLIREWQFQLTRPQGARRHGIGAVQAHFVVSTHAPARGATQSLLGVSDATGVSTHAPTRGATSSRSHGIQ